jgi:hypothetical protein
MRAGAFHDRSTALGAGIRRVEPADQLVAVARVGGAGLWVNNPFECGISQRST